jgi:hypothetical protein
MSNISWRDLAMDFCALTLAIVLIWHPLRVPSGGGQWSANRLSEEMKLTVWRGGEYERKSVSVTSRIKFIQKT